MRKQDRVAQLRKIPMFDGCSKRDLGALASDTKFEQLDAGQPLLVEGAPSTHLYVLIAGRAVVRRNGRRIAEVGPGDTVGEIGLVLGETRNASIIAETPVEFLALDRDTLRKAIDDVPGLGWNVLEAVTARMAEASTRQTWS